jgi:uncharacterized membrane protein YbhN (UPF0104 family)
MKPGGWPRRILSAALILAAFAFLGVEIARNLDELRDFRWTFRPGMLLVSLLLLVAVFCWGILVWQAVLRRFGVRADFLPLARTWFVSNVSRYIPGMVWQFVSLAQLGGKMGVPATTTVTSLLVQMGFNLIAAILVGAALLPSALAGDLRPALEVLRWLAPLGLLLVHPAVIRFLLRHTSRLTRREVLAWHGSWPGGVWLLFLASIAWLLFGAALFLFLRSFTDLAITALPAIAAVNAFAFLAGYMAFFAPGGLGFKDAALTLLLSGIVPPAIAASLAVAARLWNIAAEVLPALVLLPRRAPASPREEPPSAA